MENKELIENQFKKSLRNYAKGICVVTVFDEETKKIYGKTINSFNSVSVNPPLILYTLGKNGSNFELFLNSKYFYINILSEDQKNISEFFANQSYNNEKFDKFEIEEVKTQFNKIQIAKIQNNLTGILCEKYAQHEGGEDNKIIIGNAIKFDFSDNHSKNPLIYFDGEYRKLGEKI